MPNYMTELSPDNNAHVYQIKDKEAAPIDLLRDTVGWTGKNKLHIPDSVVTQTINGVTFTITRNSDGEVTEIDVNGTASANTSLNIKTNYVIPQGSYILTSENAFEPSKYRTYLAISSGSDVGYVQSGGLNFDADGNTKHRITLLIYSGQQLSHVKFYPMLRDASITDDTYEPYHESVEEVVEQVYADNGVLGAKNLLQNNIVQGEYRGITFTTNADKSITASGICTQNIYREIFRLNSSVIANGTKLKFSGLPKTGSYRCDINAHKLNNTYDYAIPHEFTVNWNTYDSYEIVFTIENTTDLTTPITVYPMLRLATDTDSTYQPYAMTNRELTEAVFLKRALVAGDDLDDITEYGAYGIVTGVLNTPENVSYASMIVLPIAAFNTNARSQMVYTNSNIYIRHKTGSPAAWTSWFKFTGNALV